MKNKLTGTVTAIGETGNLVCDVSESQLEEVPRDENTIVKFGPHETCGIFSAEHGQPDSTMVASVGASGFLEIEIVGESLSQMLGIKVGEKIKIHW